MKSNKILIAAFLIALLPIQSFAKSEEQFNADDIQVFFSPKGGCTESIVTLIGEAKRSIRVAAYSFTSKEIVGALVDAHKQGIDVQVVLDKSNATAKYSAADFLSNAGIPTRIDYKYAIMHNKFLVIDSETVEAGSFNFTQAAEKNNAENVLILRNSPKLAEKYAVYWQRLWDESKTYIRAENKSN